MKNSVIEEKKYVFKEAIKTVGIGKKGSRNMPPDLVDTLTEAIKRREVPPAALGAILGALNIKGLSKEEKRLSAAFNTDIFDNARGLIDVLSKEASENIKEICAQLLTGKTLDIQQAETLGDFLFSQTGEDTLRGLAASIMRVRYETPQEYCGLLQSITKTFADNFKEKPPQGRGIIQIAEPFDGVDHSSLITPLVAQHLQGLNYRVVNLVGRNSGPKNGINLFDLAGALKLTFLKSNQQLTDETPSLGYYLHQADLSTALDCWVDIRREIIKRPFLATIERFVNPVSADIFIASAFHPPYGDKMLQICEDQNYPSAIIVRNGIEGTVAFPLLRPAKILCTARLSDGSYRRHAFEYDSQKELHHTIKLEEKLTDVSAVANAGLIDDYQEKGQTENILFNMRVKATCCGLQRAIDWIKTRQDTS